MHRQVEVWCCRDVSVPLSGAAANAPSGACLVDPPAAAALLVCAQHHDKTQQEEKEGNEQHKQGGCINNPPPVSRHPPILALLRAPLDAAEGEGRGRAAGRPCRGRSRKSNDDSG